MNDIEKQLAKKVLGFIAVKAFIAFSLYYVSKALR